MKLQDHGYYGVVTMPRDVFEKLDASMFINQSTETVKYLCANNTEVAHLEALGVDLGDWCCDWFKVVLALETNSPEALAAIQARLDEAFRGRKIYSQEQAQNIATVVLRDAIGEGLVIPDFPAPKFEVEVTLEPEVHMVDISITIGDVGNDHNGT